MQKVTRYISNDGLEFDSESEAYAQDKLADLVRDIELRLLGGPVPSDPNFENGNLGFIQHDYGVGGALYEKLKELGADDSTEGALGKLYLRWCSFDKLDREFGQPYFAIHFDTAVDRMYQDRRMKS